MSVKTIRAYNIILANFYVILLVQLLFNWSETECGHSLNVWKLILLIVLFGRLFADEMFNNSKIHQTAYSIIRVTTAVILVAMAIFMIITLLENEHSFSQGTCFLNRI